MRYIFECFMANPECSFWRCRKSVVFEMFEPCIYVSYVQWSIYMRIYTHCVCCAVSRMKCVSMFAKALRCRSVRRLRWLSLLSQETILSDWVCFLRNSKSDEKSPPRWVDTGLKLPNRSAYSLLQCQWTSHLVNAWSPFHPSINLWSIILWTFPSSSMIITSCFHRKLILIWSHLTLKIVGWFSGLVF